MASAGPTSGCYDRGSIARADAGGPPRGSNVEPDSPEAGQPPGGGSDARDPIDRDERRVRAIARSIRWAIDEERRLGVSAVRRINALLGDERPNEQGWSDLRQRVSTA